MIKKLKIGDKVIIKTPSCSVQPGYLTGKDVEGKGAVVIWNKDFIRTKTQGICVLVENDEELVSAWSYYTGKEFEVVKDKQKGGKKCQRI